MLMSWSVPPAPGAERPRTYWPSWVTRKPCSLRVKLPERVYWMFVIDEAPVAELALATRNQLPSLWRATSSGLPVVCRAPVDMLLSIEPSWTPRPIWMAFEPPCAAFGAALPLREGLLERRALGLVAERVDVGDVVGRDVQHGLVDLEAADGRVHA